MTHDELRAAGLRVKPLTLTEHNGVQTSVESIFGTYEIFFDPAFGWLILLDGYEDSFVEYPSGDEAFPTCEAAADWLNSYYMARILAALEPDTGTAC